MEYHTHTQTHRLVDRLETDCRLFHRQAELKAEVGSTTKTTPITLYFVPSATEEEIAAVQEKALKIFQSVVHRRELKDKVRVCVLQSNCL